MRKFQEPVPKSVTPGHSAAWVLASSTVDIHMLVVPEIRRDFPLDFIIKQDHKLAQFGFLG